jgi:ribokinase
MGNVVVLGVFVADTAYRADRMPRMGETVLGNSFSLGPGGKGSNQAVAAGRLGADVAMISRLGQDDFAEMALNTWKVAGVTPYVTQSSDDYTGAAYIFIDHATGDNAIIIAPGAAANISAQDLEDNAELIAAADVFVTQLEQPLGAAQRGLELAKAAGVTTILNPAPAVELPAEMLALCDYVTPNETETEIITGLPVTNEAEAAQAAAALHQMGVKTPIITLGEKGAYLHGHGLIPAFSVGEVVETTGAGDAFNGGFAAALSEGFTPVEAVRIGSATAGISVTRAGTAPAMPSRDEVDALL